MRVTVLDFIFHRWRNSRLWFWSFMSILFISSWIRRSWPSTSGVSSSFSWQVYLYWFVFARPMHSTSQFDKTVLSKCVIACLCVFLQVGQKFVTENVTDSRIWCAKWIICESSCTTLPYPICPPNEIMIDYVINIIQFKLQELRFAETRRVLHCASDVHPIRCASLQEIGTMTGKGHALVVVRPGSLRETTQVLEACLEAGVAIVPQGREKEGYHGHPWAMVHFYPFFPPGAREKVAS